MNRWFCCFLNSWMGRVRYVCYLCIWPLPASLRHCFDRLVYQLPAQEECERYIACLLGRGRLIFFWMGDNRLPQNEWINEWINERTNEWMNEWTNKQKEYMIIYTWSNAKINGNIYQWYRLYGQQQMSNLQWSFTGDTSLLTHASYSSSEAQSYLHCIYGT